MKILAIAFFDPASVVLSHRDLMRAAGHDFRLAVVRAYTDRQLQADWVAEKLFRDPIGNGAFQFGFAHQACDAKLLRDFASHADVIQFHPGIGHGDGDWASAGTHAVDLANELHDCLVGLGLTFEEIGPLLLDWARARKTVAFVHGSNATRKHLGVYRNRLASFRVATSTLDYACDLDAAYLPPLVQPPIVGGAPLLARLRGDDEPLVIAHTPTDRVACSTEAFIKIANEAGVLQRLGEHMTHSDVWALKAQCNAGFDHLRGAFSTNTLENAALGLVPLFGLASKYAIHAMDKEELEPAPYTHRIETSEDLAKVIDWYNRSPDATRDTQESTQGWWHDNFSAEPVTKRLVRFYESL